MKTKATTIVEISRTIREKLKAHENLSRLSFDVRISQATLHSIMCGRTTYPRPDIVDKLCAHFGITIVAVEQEAA
ncbi:hypothetical protein [Rhizobium laguerreae]|uniref:hypothetical protein n=1 Tax=Rhizobium laguerreae TaxID=1076926 RepID=UPI001441149E|nr:hypothetical protein [Rhizobium laguerreae]NKM69111.1 hypothetical protein [Rhizobium laguerreae]